jgi:hypothetical protein
MDLISELRGAFASDAVWLTDLEPISGYDLASVDPKASTGGRGSANNGKVVVKEEFPNTNYGASSLNQIQTPTAAAAPTKRRPGPAPVAPAAATVNAIRIKGYWRDNPKSQNVVSELLKNLREKSTSFRFATKDPKGADILLSDEQILAITVQGPSEDLGFPFQITLPLAREIAIK